MKKKDFKTIVEEANRYRTPVVGHLPVGFKIGYAINNGMNSISHIHFFMNSMKWSTADFKLSNKPLLDDMLLHHIYLDPTLNVYRLTGDKKMDYYKKLVKIFSDYGIPIVAGTDNEGTIAEELAGYVQLGMSPLDALRSATIIPATLMGAANESGSIDKDKQGNLLILDENPLLNIGTLNKIPTIINGKFVIRR